MSQNTVCWVDIPVVDLDRAVEFYSAILDSELEKMTSHGFEFVLLPHAQENVSGCLSVMEDRKPSQNGPLVYLNVEGRLDKAAELATQHGGKILKPREQMGPYGCRTIVLDSEGNAIALYSKE